MIYSFQGFCSWLPSSLPVSWWGEGRERRREREGDTQRDRETDIERKTERGNRGEGREGWRKGREEMVRRGKERGGTEKGNREGMWICAVATKHRVCVWCMWCVGRCTLCVCVLRFMCASVHAYRRPGLSITPRMLFKYQSPGNPVLLDCSIYQLWTKSLM